MKAVQPQADAPREHGIEIMTMHRAKGLEFDTVVLLGLAREPRPDDPKALQWLARSTADGRDDLIMVPAAFASDAEATRLGRLRAACGARTRCAERARLLYVATTRARERLHLVWQLPTDAEEPPASSLLAHLWPVVAGTPREAATAAQRGIEPQAIVPVLRRTRLRRLAPRREHAPARTPIPAPRPNSCGRARPPRTSAPSFIATCSASRSRASSIGTRSASSTSKRAFARELELLGVEPARA